MNAVRERELALFGPPPARSGTGWLAAVLVFLVACLALGWAALG